jgi:hypothetical protein
VPVAARASRHQTGSEFFSTSTAERARADRQARRLVARAAGSLVTQREEVTMISKQTKKEIDDIHDRRRADRTRYVRVFTVPRSIPAGRVLMHNHVQHTIDMPCGLNGFRAWTANKPLPGFKRCRCGWSGLPHYSLVPNYKCKTMKQINTAIEAQFGRRKSDYAKGGSSDEG